MKIAVFSESYKPYISGVTRSIEIFEKELLALGHEVYIFAPDYPGHKDNNSRIIRFPSLPTKYPGFRIAVPLSRLIPDLGFDIVHSNSIFQLGILAMRYARKKNIPFVFTFHTMFTEYLHNVPLPRALSVKAVSFLIRSFCNRCARVIVPTAVTKKYLEGFGVSSPIDVLASGIDMELAGKASACGIRKELGISENSPVLVYVGRLSKEKNIPFLFEAFKIVLCAFDPVGAYRDTPLLLIVAGGPLEKEYKQMAEGLGISKNVVFAGQKPYPEVLDYYKASDLFVFASTTETQGLVVAEAKACGLPAVALDAQGISECIHDGQDGYLVSTAASGNRDALLKEFSDRILLLLKDKNLRKAFSLNASKNALAEFSSGVLAKKLELIYNLVSERRKQ
ncbi:MAG: glycosyltransferase [Candidatus Margulisiibacteriota bacterium]